MSVKIKINACRKKIFTLGRFINEEEAKKLNKPF